MLEIRNVANDAPVRDGAQTRVAGPFVLHAVSPLTSPDARPGIEQALAHLRAIARPFDGGHSVGSWVEGATDVPDALPETVRTRVAAVADRLDPTGRLWRYRTVPDAARAGGTHG